MHKFPHGFDLRERKKAYLGFAAVILGTWPMDLASARGAAGWTLLVRAVWAGAFVAAAFAVARLQRGGLRMLVLSLVATDVVSFLAIARLAGGATSWMFLLLALLPVFVVFSDSDDPLPASAAGFGAGAGGFGLLAWNDHPASWLVAWAAVVSASTGFSLFLVRRHVRLQRDADARQRDLEIEVLERRASEQLVLRRNSELLEIIERLPLAMALWRGPILVWASRRTAEWLGYDSAEEMIAATGLALVEAEDRDPLRIALERGGPDGPLEIRVRRKDGGLEILEITTVGAVQFEGAPATLLTGVRQTERRRLQERLTLGDRMASLGTLAAGVAHEVNNPLAWIASNLDFMADQLRAAGSRPDWLELVEQSREGVNRVERIVRDLNLFSRGDGGRDDAAVDVRAAVESACTMMHNQLKYRAIVTIDQASVPLVRGNEAKLAQVFVNLLANAVQAIPEGAASAHHIGVRTFRLDEGDVAVEVSDTGAGIAVEQLPRIFDPFWTTKPVGQGTGLGLSICHGIVAAAGGRIEVRSEVGAGTTFRVVLPVAEEIAAPAQQPLPVPAQHGCRILVIDDEAQVGIAIRRTLSDCKVELATSADEAIAALEADARFDLVLCDVLLPGVDGIEIRERIVARWPELAPRVRFMTGGVFTERARRCLEAEKGGWLQKPFRREDIERLLAA